MNTARHFLFLLTTVSLLLVAGCKLFEAPIDATTAYQNKQYAVASTLLIEEYNKESDLIKKSNIAYKIGESFRMANNTKNAEIWYAKALDYSSEPAVLFKYGLMLKANGKYKEAIVNFREYALSNPIDAVRATKERQACQQALEWQEDKTDYKILQLQGINSIASDYAPVLYADKQLVFTSDRSESMGEDEFGWTGNKYSDLFVANLLNEVTYDLPVQFGDSINTAFNEGVVSFTSDFNTVYFTACGSPHEKDDFCQIYVTNKGEGGKWRVPVQVVLFEEDTINVGHPYITPNGKELYFAADAPDSYGDKDIYMSTITPEGLWSYPKNLGPEINTENYEGFPYIGTDGRLYFASNGHYGMGGLDIYRADREKKGWTNVENLKAPINSSADDFGIVFFPYIEPEMMDKVEAEGYLSSARNGGKGADDIYKFILEIPKEEPPVVITDTVPPIPVVPKEPIYVLEGKVFQKILADPEDPNSGVVRREPIPTAVVEVLGLSANSRIGKRLVTDENGFFSLEVEKETDYKVRASSAGFLAASVNASTKGKTGAAGETVKVYVEITLDKVFIQKSITLQNIYYDLDKWDIREDAKPTLNEVASVMLENPTLLVEMGSHTDSRGKNAYNLELSQKRAESAVDYLTSKGIERSRLIAKGYGETQLTNGCADGVTCDEEQHQANRRTTFKVVSNKYRGGSAGF
ncbi:MAG: OmpA family protein [Chitinophagales bacterium]